MMRQEADDLTLVKYVDVDRQIYEISQKNILPHKGGSESYRDAVEVTGDELGTFLLKKFLQDGMIALQEQKMVH